MNYQKIYDNLIARARNRVIIGYKERHHIIPRCMQGTDLPSNLVDLTAEEHFVAHQLLLKIYPENNKIAFAAYMMTAKKIGRPVHNKAYAWLRKARAKAVSYNQLGKKRPARRPYIRKDDYILAIEYLISFQIRKILVYY